MIFIGEIGYFAVLPACPATDISARLREKSHAMVKITAHNDIWETLGFLLFIAMISSSVLFDTPDNRPISVDTE
jgi:hypothetical protein